jgi:hypothetical protein
MTSYRLPGMGAKRRELIVSTPSVRPRPPFPRFSRGRLVALAATSIVRSARHGAEVQERAGFGDAAHFLAIYQMLRPIYPHYCGTSTGGRWIGVRCSCRSIGPPATALGVGGGCPQCDPTIWFLSTGGMAMAKKKKDKKKDKKKNKK